MPEVINPITGGTVWVHEELAEEFAARGFVTATRSPDPEPDKPAEDKPAPKRGRPRKSDGD